MDQLRGSGAIEVVCQPVQMKKGRQGFTLSVIVTPEKASDLRLVWFAAGTTLGLRERPDGRWILPRRRGFCLTKFGKISAKQVKRPNGNITIKPESDDLIRLGLELGEPVDELRKAFTLASEEFVAEEDWTW